MAFGEARGFLSMEIKMERSRIVFADYYFFKKIPASPSSEGSANYCLRMELTYAFGSWTLRLMLVGWVGFREDAYMTTWIHLHVCIYCWFPTFYSGMTGRQVQLQPFRLVKGHSSELLFCRAWRALLWTTLCCIWGPFPSASRRILLVRTSSSCLQFGLQ